MAYFTSAQSLLGHAWSISEFAVRATVDRIRAAAGGRRIPAPPLFVTDATERLTLDLLSILLPFAGGGVSRATVTQRHVDTGWDFTSGNAMRVTLPDHARDTLAQKNNQYKRSCDIAYNIHSLGASRRAAPYQDMLTFDGDTTWADRNRDGGNAMWYANGLSVLCNFLENELPTQATIQQEDRFFLLLRTTSGYAPDDSGSGTGLPPHTIAALHHLVTHLYAHAGSVLCPAQYVIGSTYPTEIAKVARDVFFEEDMDVNDAARLLDEWPRAIIAWADNTQEEGPSSVNVLERLQHLHATESVSDDLLRSVIRDHDALRGEDPVVSYEPSTRLTGYAVLDVTVRLMLLWLSAEGNRRAAQAWMQARVVIGNTIVFVPNADLPETDAMLQRTLRLFHRCSVVLLRILRLSSLALVTAALQRQSAILGDDTENVLREAPV